MALYCSILPFIILFYILPFLSHFYLLLSHFYPPLLSRCPDITLSHPHQCDMLICVAHTESSNRRETKLVREIGFGPQLLEPKLNTV